MLNYVQSTIALILGIIASITDFKDKKIYNKHIIIACIISVCTYIYFFKEIETEYIRNSSINFIITLIISLCFYYFRIWAAGDAKLFVAIIFMIPYNVYETQIKNVFPALNLLIIIFSIAFIYIFIETIFLWIKDERKFEKFKISKMSKKEIIEYIISYFMGYFLIVFINNMVYTFGEEIAINNAGLLLLCNMLLLMFIYRVIDSKKKMMFALSMFILANVIYHVIMGFAIMIINVKMLLIVLIIVLFRKVAEEYNYEEIKIENLKERMILSYGSVLKFYGSKVKGLPEFTTENTNSRLTKEEVESIKRWSRTKRGTDELVIVRHLPFAPFMLCGEIIFFILRIYS